MRGLPWHRHTTAASLAFIHLVLLPVGGRLEAQAVSLSAGFSSWTCCLADRGGAAVAVRLDVPIGSVLLLEPGATWLRLGNQAQPPHETHFVLELSVQARLPIGGPVAPFLGVGAGLPTNVAGDFLSPPMSLQGCGVTLVAAGTSAASSARARPAPCKGI
jgi:hypothetical protein